MFQVVTMRGYSEPWWFFDDWQEDIIDSREFSHLSQASEFFVKLNLNYQADFDNMKAKYPYCVAFWNDEDIEYCEECDDDVQIFTGIVMVDQDYQLVIVKDGEISVKKNQEKIK